MKRLSVEAQLVFGCEITAFFLLFNFRAGNHFGWDATLSDPGILRIVLYALLFLGGLLFSIVGSLQWHLLFQNEAAFGRLRRRVDG